MTRLLVVASVVLFVSLCVLRCTGAPLYPINATIAEYCTALSSYVRVCKVTDPCAVATSGKDCETLAAGYSEAGIDAITTCLDAISCGDGGAIAQAACAEYWIALINPSDAQAKLATDYCTACPPAGQTAAECEPAFYATIDDAGDEAGTLVVIPGTGFPLLPRTDSVVLSADTACVPKLIIEGGAPGCETFGACALQIIQAKTPAPPAACASDDASDDASTELDGGAD
jgi:hypothetical protein